VRTRKLIWLLAAMLSLGSLQAAPPTRLAPSAQIRPAACFVIRDLVSRRRADRLPRYIPSEWNGTAGSPLVRIPALIERRFDPAFVARFRFQLPPPDLA